MQKWAEHSGVASDTSYSSSPGAPCPIVGRARRRAAFVCAAPCSLGSSMASCLRRGVTSRPVRGGACVVSALLALWSVARGLAASALAGTSSTTRARGRSRRITRLRAERELRDRGLDRRGANLHDRPRLGLAPHDGERDRPEGRRLRCRPDLPDDALAEADLVAVLHGLGEPQPTQVAIRLALVVQPRDRLLADV